MKYHPRYYQDATWAMQTMAVVHCKSGRFIRFCEWQSNRVGKPKWNGPWRLLRWA